MSLSSRERQWGDPAHLAGIVMEPGKKAPAGLTEALRGASAEENEPVFLSALSAFSLVTLFCFSRQVPPTNGSLAPQGCFTCLGLRILS